MGSMLPFSMICYLMLTIIVFRATTLHGAAVEPSRKLAAWNSGGVKLTVIHVYGDSSPYKPPNSTWESLISHTFNIDTASDVPVASGKAINRGNYIIKVDFGTPGKSFYTFIDTGSDMTWIPCTPCSDCDLESNTPFDPSSSSTYRSLTCDSALCNQLDGHYNPSLCATSPPDSSCVFNQTYGDNTSLEAALSTDTLLAGSDMILNFAFGCAGQETIKAPGIIGLGRGAFSFVSQTMDLYDNTFSYCLPSLESSQFSGSLILGKEALSASASASLSFTPLLTNPGGPSYYYIGLKGISVGGELLSDIPPETFELNTLDGGGTIIDSGTDITRLAEPAYNSLRDAFRRKLSNLQNNMTPSDFFDTCYDVSTSGNIDAPPITLHFDGGVDVELTQEMILYKQGSVACLAFALPPERSSSKSIIGNYQQQNMRVVYDVPNSRIGFAVENCSA